MPYEPLHENFRSSLELFSTTFSFDSNLSSKLAYIIYEVKRKL